MSCDAMSAAKTQDIGFRSSGRHPHAATAPPKSTERLIGDYYAACMDQKAIDALGVKALSREMAWIHSVASIEDLQPVIEKLNEEAIFVPFVFASMGGGALNDFFDANKDAVNRPYRPIPKGSVTCRFALVLALTLLAGSLSLGVVAGETMIARLLYASAVGGVVLYNVIVAKLAPTKGFWTGLLCALPVMYLTLEYGVSVLLPIAVCAYVTGREILMDIVDLRGDSMSGLRTIPLILGTRLASRLGFGLIFGGAALFAGVSGHWITRAVLSCFLIPSVALWQRESDRVRGYVVYLVWVPMLLGPAFLLR